jgi:DnaJ homolog subfamily C member 9
MHVIEEAFGSNCNLYTDVLDCSSDADKAALRKAYYRTALKYHPDKNPHQAVEASKKFHAITAAYQILCDVELRTEYDDTGTIPNSNDVDDDFNAEGKENPWKDYFDRIFGKVSLGDIEAFAMKYKCSDEERRDVIKEFISQKGNLVKMMDYVMLSEPRDAQRWVEDYIQPSVDSGEIQTSYSATMNKTLQQLQKKAEKEYSKEELEEDNDTNDEEMDANVHDDDDETEDENEVPQRKQRPASTRKAKSPSPKKAKTIKAKVKNSNKATSKKKKKDDMTDLIAHIQNKNRNGTSTGSNSWSNFGARYGVTIDDDDHDPLQDDKAFAKIQSKLKSGTKKKLK